MRFPVLDNRSVLQSLLTYIGRDNVLNQKPATGLPFFILFLLKLHFPPFRLQNTQCFSYGCSNIALKFILAIAYTSKLLMNTFNYNFWKHMMTWFQFDNLRRRNEIPHPSGYKIMHTYSTQRLENEVKSNMKFVFMSATSMHPWRPSFVNHLRTNQLEKHMYMASL